MALASWDPRYETGIELIDAQHRRLFASVQALSSVFEGAEVTPLLRKALDALLDDTVAHFRMEEELMQRFGYPGFAAHASEHARLVGEIDRLMVTVTSGKPISPQISAFLADWLQHHVLEADMGYVPFLKAHGLT
ncbi:MAG TPA: bacteriohemerythrin [Holophagaceae bacterium]